MFNVMKERGNSGRLKKTAYSLPNVIRVMKSKRMRWAEHMTRVAEMRNAHEILVGKPGRKRPLAKFRHRWEDNIRMDLTETGWEGEYWINLAQDRDQWRALVNTVINLRVHNKRGIF